MTKIDMSMLCAWNTLSQKSLVFGTRSQACWTDGDQLCSSLCQAGSQYGVVELYGKLIYNGWFSQISCKLSDGEEETSQILRFLFAGSLMVGERSVLCVDQ